eukprot:gb/GFBE01009014.1/.p1 GENE.gb/GFBE01009014.1/~~gb/GFBE01009014.1/.p1  ORF type:complete len:316 (+),score=79.26 gb/GFBE01009014.1/:1-948(+)
MLCLIVLAALAAPGSCLPKGFKVSKLREIPHEGKPWTQGLELFESGKVIETSGAYPAGEESFIRVVDLSNGEVVSQTGDGLEGRFVEGIARSADGWIVTTYESMKAVKYDSELTVLAELDYPYEGWGFSRSPDGSRYFASNGTAYIMELHPGTLELQQVWPARCLGKDVVGINEMEMVEDFFGLGPTLLGNIYQTRFVVGFDINTYDCNCVFDLEDLEESDAGEGFGVHVANGIAHLPDSGNFVVTGKNWANMFEIALTEDNNTKSEAVSKLSNWLNPSIRQGFLALHQSSREVPASRLFSTGRRDAQARLQPAS